MEYRKNLPILPERLRRLPLQRGYPVPWFVAMVDGTYDFRIIDPEKMAAAVESGLCWICGEKLGTTLAFNVGPMCVINRISGEPPSHKECATYAAIACPFLTNPSMKRNTVNLPEKASYGEGHIEHNPEVTAIYLTSRYQPFENGESVLFAMGDPINVVWYKEARPATRQECIEAIKKAIPILLESCIRDKENPFAIKQMEESIKEIDKLLPLGQLLAKKFLGSTSKKNERN